MRSFAFVVIIYFVFTRINCDINSSYIESKYSYLGLVNKTNSSNFSPLKLNLTLENDIKLELNIKETLLSREERGKLCLKNVTRCRQNDFEYETTTSILSKTLFARSPPFDLSRIKGVSLQCQRESKKYLKDLAKFKMWALKMYDSTAKLPSGMLNGNINQLGDFDMCLNAISEEQDIYGKYCLAYMQIDAPHSSYLSGIHRLIHSHFHFKSKLEDPGHRVPRFSSVNWALCVPSSCSTKDVEIGLKETVNSFIKDTEIKVKFEVDPAMCQSKKDAKEIPRSTWIAGGIFLTVIVAVLLASVYETYTPKEQQNEWIMAFSLKKNLKSMFKINKNPSDIEAVHGIRFLNAILLLLAHKSMALFFLPWANRTTYVETVSQPWTVIGRAASLYTDPFIMFSGALTTYALLGRLEKMKKLNLFQEYVSRLMRILPTFAALISFCTFILPWLNNGPMWNLVVTHHSHICKKNWWRNLLFIHNYFGFKEMCLTHTHHVGIDTQLFFTSPFLIYTIWRWPKNGSIALLAIATVSTIMRYYVTYTMRLSNYIHFGTSIQELFDTADYMYILPVHRATVYIMGIFLGYLLRFHRNTTLTIAQLRIGNALALFSYLTSFLVPSFMGDIDYVYNPTHAAWYAAFAPILWCFAFAWIVFTSHIGYKGFVGEMFSKPVFTLWTKISYTVYLTQFPAYFYNVGITRSPENYEFFRTMFNFKEYLWILVLSCTLTLLFESPFQNIRNIIFRKTPRKISEVAVEKKIS